MKKKVLQFVNLFLCVSILASAAGCGLSGVKVTGKIEDGKLIVWRSPQYTQLWIDTKLSDNVDLYTAFPDDIETVDFSSEEEFTTSLAQKLSSGEGPDVVLAYADEISPKMLGSGMFANLDPFLDYEDKQISAYDLVKKSEDIGSNTEDSNTVIKREDLIMNLIDLARYNGKLYYMPIGVGVGSLQGNEENLKYGGMDLYNNKYTPAEFLSALKKEKPIEVGGETYSEFTALPKIDYVFKNFIDYEKKTTRMGDNICYEYFCAYAQSLIDHNKRESSENNKIWNSTHTAYTLTDSCHYSFYSVSNSPIWHGINILSDHNLDLNIGYVLGAMPQKQYDLTLSDAPQPNMPSEYGAKYYVSMNATTVAAISACSKHLNKAFAYIKAYLGEPLHDSNTVSFTSPNIHTYTDYLKDDGYSDKQIKKIFDDINNGEYVWVWTDSNIEKMFHDLLYDTVDDQDVLKETIPTREEWNALKTKIETYLNE